jgi:hypothetical protein
MKTRESLELRNPGKAALTLCCTNKCKTIMHCVFNTSEPHGDCYCVISEFLNARFCTNVPILHHMVRVDDTNEDFQIAHKYKKLNNKNMLIYS